MEFITNGNPSIYSTQNNTTLLHTDNITNDFNIVYINGKLDISLAEKLENEFTSKMTSQKNIIIDMSRCEYISNYGLYFLSLIVNKAKLLNIKIIFTSIIDKISEIFELTGFSNAIELAPTFEDAIKEYAFN